MPVKHVVVLSLLASAVFAAPAEARPLTPNSRVSTAGLGPVRIGMTPRQAERAADTRLVSEGAALNGCRYVRPATRSLRAAFMVINGRIARVDVSRRGIATTSGIRVGDREASVRRRFGRRLRISRHVYVPGGRYLEFVPRDRAERNRRVIFETNGSRVTYIRAGRLPEVRYIEGCA